MDLYEVSFKSCVCTCRDTKQKIQVWFKQISVEMNQLFSSVTSGQTLMSGFLWNIRAYLVKIIGWNLKEVMLLTFLFWVNPLSTTQLPPWTDQNSVNSKDQIIEQKLVLHVINDTVNMPSHTCIMLTTWYGSQKRPNITTIARMSFSLRTFRRNLVCLRRLRMRT